MEMRKLLVGMLAIAAMATQAQAQWWYRGEANGWGVTAMTDNADGTYSTSITGAANGFTAWKVSASGDPGNWDTAFPMSADSWGYYDGTGSLSITFDTNNNADGWTPATNRQKINYEPGNQWQAVGDFNGWSNNDSNWYMSPLGGGVYSVTGTIAAPGNHFWKAIEAGSWNAIGNDGRTLNADNIPFSTSLPNEQVIFQVDVLRGVTRVIPEPASMALLGLGAVALMRRSRR